eukprot:9644457-Alexandrium_andersonii.AAC.1
MGSSHNGATPTREREAQLVEGLILLPGGGRGVTAGGAARGAHPRSATTAGGAGSGGRRGPTPVGRPP